MHLNKSVFSAVVWDIAEPRLQRAVVSWRPQSSVQSARHREQTHCLHVRRSTRRWRRYTLMPGFSHHVRILAVTLRTAIIHAAGTCGLAKQYNMVLVACCKLLCYRFFCNVFVEWTRGQSNLTKSASRRAHSPVRGHPRGSKFVPLNSWGRVSY